ncbi:hypothetical protein ACFSM5_04970 [Lacibacterium aquatile]|uniref:Uncharacterized protein n=1 Tax=Lacibacterium aquatile TaxID=1168082 RepID=A0ABW5DNX1_9PROT
MSDAVVVSVGGQTIGLAVRQRRGYRFYASAHSFNRIDRHIFRRVRDLQRAATALIQDKGGIEA